MHILYQPRPRRISVLISFLFAFVSYPMPNSQHVILDEKELHIAGNPLIESFLRTDRTQNGCVHGYQHYGLVSKGVVTNASNRIHVGITFSSFFNSLMVHRA